MKTSTRIERITRVLCETYPDRRPLLNFNSPYQLLIAVILSAQTTDAQVNVVTPGLFDAYPTASDLAKARVAAVEKLVHSTGFYRNKAKNIIGAAAAIEGIFAGVVPESMEDLVSIPGVGRKTANVIRGVIFGHPSIVVDTHLSRVTNRLGLVSSRNPDVIERELRSVVPAKTQTDFSMAVNLHGRYRCFARGPDCGDCEILALCPFPGQSVQR